MAIVSSVLPPWMDSLQKASGSTDTMLDRFPLCRLEQTTPLDAGPCRLWGGVPYRNTTQILAANGYHTAAMVDTPFYLRAGMNYDRGFDTFMLHPGQDAPGTKEPAVGHQHESQDVRSAWRYEADGNSPQTMMNAMKWLERHYKEDFFLYVDTWDPHEPWDSPVYYTEPFWSDYDGEVIDPLYGRWRDVPGFTEDKVRKAHATYMGQISMVDTWVGYLLKRVEDMGLMDTTAILFTSDHGFYFGEHGGLFGKLIFDKKDDGTLPRPGDDNVTWDHSPLYEELVHIPLLIYVPRMEPGVYDGLTSVVDVMPTVLEVLGQNVPESVQGSSLVPKMRDHSIPGRDFVISTMPFANPGEEVRHVDDLSRMLRASPVTTVTTGNRSLLYSMDPGFSELFDLKSDTIQQNNLIASNTEVAKELHQLLFKFMRDTNLPSHLLDARLELKI